MNGVLKSILLDDLLIFLPGKSKEDCRGVRRQLQPLRPRLHLGVRQRAEEGDAHVSEKYGINLGRDSPNS
jgi:hypothetical protein